MENKYSNILTIALIAGIVIILIGVCIAGFFMMRNNNLNQEDAEAVEQYQKNVNKPNETENETEKENAIEENTQAVIIEPSIGNEAVIPLITETNTINGNQTENKKETKYKGYPMVGTIEIPAINLSSPVLKEATKNSMQVAVGIYDGVGLNEIGNTTIAGHNYKDGRFFSNIKKLVEGDKVHITDETGRKITYVVYKAPYITNREDISYLERDTEGKREVTLIGCTDDVQNIYVVWAKEI